MAVDIRDVMHPQAPFGPIKSEDFVVGGDLALFRRLYSSGSEIHRRMAKFQPNCLIGRKGAGKTAFLLGTLGHDGDLVIQLKQSSLFEAMENVSRAFYAADASLNAELMAEIWELAVYHALAIRLADTHSRTDPEEPRRTIWSYMLSIERESGDLIEPADSQAERCDKAAFWILTVLQEFVEAGDNRAAGSAFIKNLSLDGITFEALRLACQDVVKARSEDKSDCVVLVDTLEDFGEQFTRLAEVTRGLMQFLAQHRPAQTGFRFFVCLPSEVTGLLRTLSANPAKSFEHSIHIEWTSRDLVSLAAHRFLVYMREYERHRFDRLALGSPSRLEFTDARKILEDVLPDQVSNGLGMNEASLLYVMRHTQLLPRQFIHFLNRIWRTHALESDDPFNVSEKAVLDGVAESEQALLQDILNAYGAPHPMAADVCEVVIPRLNMSTAVVDVQKQIRDSKVYRDVGRDVRGTMQLLVDIGALGRRSAVTERYVEAEFSFTFPNMAPLQEDEVACVHPMFASRYQCVEVRLRHTRETHPELVPVYPFGATFEAATDVA